jgi:hypothetical protein
MGVKGLWQLLQPVARPIKSVVLLSALRSFPVSMLKGLVRDIRIETLEGKRLAIDSS